jgi:ferredoxin-NADP reductase/Na+-translocating ferredoxin:NAD+ oxidoreductase RnfD subunit
MIKRIDDVLDGVTMYRLALYYLVALLAAALVSAIAGALPVTPFDLATSTILVLGVCWVTNAIFSRVFKVPESHESVLITGLIVVLIMRPAAPGDFDGLGALVFAAVWAMAGKYIFAIGRRHLFNPAALGVGLSAVLLDQPPTWWAAGNIALLPFVVIGGLVMVRKLRRGDLVLGAIVAAIAAVLLATPPDNVATAIADTLLYSPLLFAAFVMLTEPSTTPPTRLGRVIYGAIVGVLLTPAFHIGALYFTPEAALLIGNLFAYAISPKRRLALTLQRVERSAATSQDFVFASDRPLAFAPGQYLEFALGVPHGDSRGNHRYFTIASAPTEADLRLGVKFNPQPSAFKAALAALRPGDTVFASGLAGDFVLPRRHDAKLAFLAGGIGITPFRSMLKYLLDRGERRPIVLLYAAEKRDDLAYGDIIARAHAELGIRTAYALARDPGGLAGAHHGFIDEAFLVREIPDYRERMFYVSGPRAMVAASEALLRRLGVAPSRIKVDFFPGFA